MRKAVFPGSFDPFTRGHESIVRKAIPLFDEIVIAIGQNSKKSSFFELDQRIAWIKQTFESEKSIVVLVYEGLTVDLCHKIGASYILRGLRNSRDFEYESAIAHMNQSMKPEIETVFLLCEPEYAAINSTIVREIYRSGGKIDQFLPSNVTIDTH